MFRVRFGGRARDMRQRDVSDFTKKEAGSGAVEEERRKVLSEQEVEGRVAGALIASACE